MRTRKASSLERIRPWFVGKEAALERAFETSESFRELCTDYLICREAVARWQESRSDKAQLRVTEYEKLAAEIAAEIEAALGVAT